MVGIFESSLDREKHYPWLLLTKCNTTLSISISVTSLSVCLLCVLFPAAFPFLLLFGFLQLIRIPSWRIFKSLDLQFEMSVHGRITFENKLILSYYSIR